MLLLGLKLCHSDDDGYCTQRSDDCVGEKVQKACVPFDKKSLFANDSRSVFVIEANGRLGNHLIAYTLVQALAKTLDVRAFILTETVDYLSR